MTTSRHWCISSVARCLEVSRDSRSTQ